MLERTKVLVVDDERKIVEVVKAYLIQDGYDVLAAYSGTMALELFETAKPDLVILDLMLPGLSGEEVCARLRARSRVPILMLTAKTAEEERVAGLNIGADDYVLKPFSPKELMARVRALLRRVEGSDRPLADELRLRDGRLVVDLARYEVSLDGQIVPLTSTEFRLFVTLAARPGRVYTRVQLGESLQGYGWERDERTIDAHVKKIRQKFASVTSDLEPIATVYGIGYRYEEPRTQ